MTRRVLVGMSGGVDSSVAAYLLKKQGYDIVGVFMRNGVEVETSNQKSCCSVDDAYDARRVADMLDIPFYSINLKNSFNSIINYFVNEYENGRTPNPCSMCNKSIKFGEIFKYAKTLKCDYIATGHYARVEQKEGCFKLLRGRDMKKDQSYFLFQIDRIKLGNILMPIGQYTKNEVRDIASKANIPVVNKPDSQQICFVPDNNYRELLKEMGVATSNGPIKTIDGRSIGTHNGYQFYTIGQREGLGVSLGKPMYVVDIVPKENTIVIGEDSELLSDSALIENTNWLVEVPETFEAEVQIRHGSAPISAIITKINSQKYKIKFKSQARAVTPGQAAVCYNGDVMLGGGWLEKANITKKL